MKTSVSMLIITATLCAFLAPGAFSGGNENNIETLLRSPEVLNLRQAAENGTAQAQFELGDLYRSLGIDYAEAMRWFERAAKQGHVYACIRLGHMHANGEGVIQDYVESVKWFLRVAEKGEPIGQLNVAHMYKDGRGVEKDYVQAHMWYNLASAGFARQKDEMRREYAAEERERVAEKMTAEQIAEAQRMARSWTPILNK